MDKSEKYAQQKAYRDRRKADPVRNAAHLAKVSARNKAYRAANKAKADAVAAAWLRDHPEESRRHRDRWRLKKYNLTPEQYDEMHEDQGGLCALCGQPETRKSSKDTLMRLAVDHDHDTGANRELLCCDCNMKLGKLLESSWTTRAIAYLRKHGKEIG